MAGREYTARTRFKVIDTIGTKYKMKFAASCNGYYPAYQTPWSNYHGTFEYTLEFETYYRTQLRKKIASDIEVYYPGALHYGNIWSGYELGEMPFKNCKIVWAYNFTADVEWRNGSGEKVIVDHSATPSRWDDSETIGKWFYNNIYGALRAPSTDGVWRIPLNWYYNIYPNGFISIDETIDGLHFIEAMPVGWVGTRVHSEGGLHPDYVIESNLVELSIS